MLSGISRLNKAIWKYSEQGLMKYCRFEIGRSADIGLRTDFVKRKLLNFEFQLYVCNYVAMVVVRFSSLCYVVRPEAKFLHSI